MIGVCMIREIRTSSLGLRIRNILTDFPVLTMQESQDTFSLICVKARVISSKSKTSKAFRSNMDHMESWADGWVEGRRADHICELMIVSGSFRTSSTSSDAPAERIVIFCVHDVEQFLIDLRQLAQVSSVQQS